MITIPTCELIGLLNDAIPFAHPIEEVTELHCVRLEWDGQMLHTLAFDQIRIAISSWHPDDPPEGDTQEDLLTAWGGADEPWKVGLALPDAKKLVEVFKPASKKRIRAPLDVDVDPERRQVTVKRGREMGQPALAATLDDTFTEFPDVRKMLGEHGALAAVKDIAFTASFIADFARVRARGALELSFTGETGITHVAIGERFAGAIQPVRRGTERPASTVVAGTAN